MDNTSSLLLRLGKATVAVADYARKRQHERVVKNKPLREKLPPSWDSTIQDVEDEVEKALT